MQQVLLEYVDQCKGVRPEISGLLGSAPHVKSRIAVEQSPRTQAQDSVVLPLASILSMVDLDVEARASSKAALEMPKYALCKGEKLRFAS